MSNDFYSLVTDIGATKQLESIRDGVPFDVYEIALGDSNGNYYTPQTNQTAQVTSTIADYQAKSGKVVVTLTDLTQNFDT